MIVKAFTTSLGATAAALLLGCFTAAPASAQAGLYVQGGYSFYQFEAGNTGKKIDTNAVTARVGWQFGPHFSIEGDLSGGLDNKRFDFNDSEDRLNFDGNNDGDFNDIVNVAGDIGMDYLGAAYAKWAFPVGDKLDLFVRGGYAYVQLDANVRQVGTSRPVTIAEDSEDGFTAGAGAEYRLNDRWSIRADYTWFGFDDVDTNSGTIGIGYHF